MTRRIFEWLLAHRLANLELARRREVATHDPLFAWNVARPDGAGITIQVTLEPATVRQDEGRRAFWLAARATLARHERPEQRMVLSGLPAIRAESAGMIMD